MKWKLDGLVTAVLVTAAIVIAAANVRMAFVSAPSAATPPADARYVEDWEDYLVHAVKIGNADAAVKIVEFADLQCPFCKKFHSSFEKIYTEFSDVALYFVHYPLRMHEKAHEAAVASECADRGYKFAEFISAVYMKQDSIGRRPWTAYAADAGIDDTEKFVACIAENESFPRIEQGRTLGAGLGINGTPTVMINGWQVSAPPYDDDLRRAVRRVLAGDRPFER